MIAENLIAYAAENSEETMSFGERSLQAGQMLLIGMLSVFAILALLWGILSITKIFTYTIPQKKKQASESEKAGNTASPAPDAVWAEETENADDGAIIAAITAAVSMMLETEAKAEGREANGFRVVSFARRTSRAKRN